MVRLAIVALLIPSVCFAFISEGEIARQQRELSSRPLGERIAFWAEKFVGTPYDPDPIGEYVTKRAIIADERVDCMYLTFRAVELALAENPDESLRVALHRRFIDEGKIDHGKVLNYEDRFRYGEDMLDSGKWGKEITAGLGKTSSIPGSRGRKDIIFITRREAEQLPTHLMSGDIIFFIRAPKNRITDEIVGHMGIIKKEGDKVFLVHASGMKNKGGKVKKVLFSDYLSLMPFIGIRVSRFGTDESGPE